MKFVDEVDIFVRAGDGGDGCVSFLREKHRPRGGPAGGDGGDGGDVRLRTEAGLSTLLELTYTPEIRARRGGHGSGKRCHGRRGSSRTLRVPVGTVVWDAEMGELIGDLARPGQDLVVARGGRGGWGNARFASPTRQAPRHAQRGSPGQMRRLRLELRLLADVGLVGLPNAGKSTLLRAISAARPRAAAYPFTTLVPCLGMVRRPGLRSFVVADLPGLIEGAHRGEGLGVRFLRHVARTRILAHLISLSPLDAGDPMAAFETVNAELAAFDPELARRPQLVVATKLDLEEARSRFADVQRRFAVRGIVAHPVSAATRSGLEPLLQTIERALASEDVSTTAMHAGGSA